MKRYFYFFLLLIGITSLGITGCATNDYAQGRLSAIQKKVAENQETIEKIRKEVLANQSDINHLQTSSAKQKEQIGNIAVSVQDAMQKVSSVVRVEMENVANAVHEAMAGTRRASIEARSKILGKTIKEKSDPVFFSYADSLLSDEARRKIDSFIEKVAKHNEGIYLEIRGHTDSIGSEVTNLKLGQNRATEVKRYLHAKHGIPLERMSAVSYGETNPIIDNATEVNRQKNRRVVIVVTE